jgi:hypothetical protein
MRSPARTGFAVATVALVGGVSMTAAALNPPGAQVWLMLCGFAAAATAVQAVSAEPRELLPALLLALMPVVGLASDGAPSWPGPLFAALLLLAGELSALAWEGRVGMAEGGLLSARLQEAGLVAVAGLGVAAFLGGVARIGLIGGTWAVVVGSAGLMGVGWQVFARAGLPPYEQDTRG